ncbi:MAG: Na+-dependent transporter [Proteobacteria bacterium]|nr:Na+-dependent transporter [Pseudomonadota bacterium]
MNLQKVLSMALTASIMLTVLGLGLTATWPQVTSLLRRPTLLLRSLLSMNVLMPVVTALVATAFAFPFEVRLALVALAVSPVPPVLYKRQLGAGGTRAYVVGLLVAMALLAIVLVPASVWVLDRIYAASFSVSPMAIAAIMLRTILLPLAAGLLVRSVLPAAEKASAHIIALAGLLLVVGAAMLLYTLWPLTRQLIGNGTVLMMAVVAALGLLIGHALGGPEPPNRTALALATCSRHPAVAFAIASGTGAPARSLLAAILLYVVVSAIVSIPYGNWRARRAAAGAVPA